jgi:beta-galactosidase
MVSIASYWNENSGHEVIIYSNCEEVGLSLNGKEIAKQKPDTGRTCNNLSHPPFTFRLPGFTPGKLITTGFIEGKPVGSDTVNTPGPPAAIRLWLDDEGRKPQAGENDVLFVYAEIIDTDGNRVWVNYPDLQFGVTGDAAILNPGSIGISEAGIATALVRIGEVPGEITISAESSGLEGVITLHQIP